MMKGARWIMFFGAWLATCAMHAATAPRLQVTTPTGEVFEQLAVRDGAVVVVKGGKAQPMPEGAAWRLDGELRAAAPNLFWIEDYTLQRRELADNAPEAKTRPMGAIVSLLAGDAGWSAAALADGIAVFLWVKDGRVVQLAPAVVRGGRLREGMIVAQVRFRLSEADASGAPAVLVWKNGGWIAPRLWFRDAAANRVVEEIHLGSDATVRDALQSRKTARRTGVDGVTLLHLAAGAGNVAAVETLLAAGVRPTAKDDRTHATPLEWAADRGRTSAIARLGEPTLHALRTAVQRGHAPTAAALAARARPPLQNRTLAQEALAAGMTELAESLYGAGAATMARDVAPEQLTEQVAREHPTRAQALLAHGIDVHGETGGAALRLAATNGFAELVRTLLRAGVPPDPADAREISALALAARMGHRDVADALLMAGAKIDRAAAGGQTPLQLAVFADDPRMAGWLLARGARVQADPVNGRSALHLALLWQARAAVDALTRAGARIDLSAPNAPEVLAAAFHLDADELIARALADGWDKLSVEGWSPLGIARAYEAARVEALLRQRGAHDSELDLVASENLDAAPEVIDLPLPSDLRAPTRAWPRTRVIVRGVLYQGRLRFPRVEGLDDAAAAIALAHASAAWRFQSPRQGGQDVMTRITLPLMLPAEPQQVFSPAEVDAVALQVTPAAREHEETVVWFPMAGFGLSPAYSLSPIWAPGSNPTVRDMIADLATGRPIFVSRSDTTRRPNTGRRALVNFVIDENGRPTHAEVAWTANAKDATTALEAVRRYRYTPALISGRAVRVQTSEWIELN